MKVIQNTKNHFFAEKKMPINAYRKNVTKMRREKNTAHVFKVKYTSSYYECSQRMQEIIKLQRDRRNMILMKSKNKNGNELLSKEPTIEWNRCDEKIWNESESMECWKKFWSLLLYQLLICLIIVSKKKNEVLNAVKIFAKLSKTKEQQNYNVNQEKLTH